VHGAMNKLVSMVSRVAPRRIVTHFAARVINAHR
jgi:hypothetical protein